jgi:hypothetical protein
VRRCELEAENKFISRSRSMLGLIVPVPFNLTRVATPSQPWFDPDTATSGAGRSGEGEHAQARADIFPRQPTEPSLQYYR